MRKTGFYLDFYVKKHYVWIRMFLITLKQYFVLSPEVE